MTKFYLAVTVLLFSFVSSGAKSASVMEKLQTSYQTVQTIRATFHQVYHSARFEEKKANGMLTILKPGQMRWDYKDPKGKVLVSNGKETILYDPQDRQANVSKHANKTQIPIALSFLWGDVKLNELFTCKEEKSSKKKDSVWISCLPKEEIPNLQKVKLQVSTKGPIVVTATRVYDQIGGENEIRFTNIELNPKVSKKTFQFKIPKGTHIVSLDND